MPEIANAAESVCPVCGGSGWRIIERDGISAADRCDCSRIGRPARLEEKARIPPRYQSASFENFVLPRDQNPITHNILESAFRTVRSYVREFPVLDKPGLLLIGPPGTGKTHLAVAVLRALIGRGFEGLFYSYQELLEHIRAGYDEVSGSSNPTAFQDALDAPILVLDDLGAQRYKEWVEDTINSIITHRYNNNKPLIATTNLPDENERIVDYMGGATPVYKKTLPEIIGQRARSRLHEMCRTISLTGADDYRKRRT